jgi:hypothetical protein
MVRLCTLFFLAFCALYLFAILIWVIGTFGWFGTDKDPLSGAFLIILGLPWARWVDRLPESLWPLGGILAPAINASVIYAVCRFFGRG